jgi:isocitrate/isopropylmalate dehydrogenase
MGDSSRTEKPMRDRIAMIPGNGIGKEVVPALAQ